MLELSATFRTKRKSIGNEIMLQDLLHSIARDETSIEVVRHPAWLRIVSLGPIQATA